MTVPSWLENLRNQLCELYKLIGGDCADLGVTPRDQIDSVDAGYGPLTPPQPYWQQINSLLDSLETLREDPTNPLSSSDDKALAALINQLRGKVQP